jgi:hypothetical protein
MLKINRELELIKVSTILVAFQYVRLVKEQIIKNSGAGKTYL